MRTLVPHPVVVTPCLAFDYADLVAYSVITPVITPRQGQGRERIYRLARQVMPVVILLLVLSADSDSVDVRRRIDSLRTARSKTEQRLVLPSELDVGRCLTVEFKFGRALQSAGQMRFTKMANRVIVQRVIVRSYENTDAAEVFDAGCTIEFANITLEQYQSFHRRILMVLGARLRGGDPESKSATEPLPPFRGWAFLRAAGVEHLQRLPFDQLPIEGTIPPSTRVGICLAVANEASSEWEFKETRSTELESRLMSELSDCVGFRREWRVIALGFLGHTEAIPTLEKLRPKEWAISRSLEQLRVISVSRDDPKTAAVLLRSLVPHRDKMLASWARTLLREAHPDLYADDLRGQYATAGPHARKRIVLELERMSKTVPEQALRDSSAEVRVEAARIADHAPTLVRLASAKKLRSFEQHAARQAAIIYLSSPSFRGIASVSLALREIVRDETDDVIVRRWAANTLGRLGCSAAGPDILRLLTEPVPQTPLYLGAPDPSVSPEVVAIRRSVGIYLQIDDVRAFAAESLGWLRHAPAEKPLARLLDSATSEREWLLREKASLALALLGSVSLLSKHAQRNVEGRADHWGYCTRLARAVSEQNLEELLKMRPVSTEWTAQLLARKANSRTLSKLAGVASGPKQKEVLRRVDEIWKGAQHD